jgi:sarcosine oxidase
MRPDVIVVGLGTMGVAAAHALAGRGLKVVGLDRFVPPHDRGAHAGGTRMFRTAYMEGAAYVPLVREALRRWRELEVETGEDLVTVTGGLMLGRTDSVAVSGALATAQAYDLPHELLDPGEVRRRFRAFTPADDELGLWEQTAGFIRPEAGIAAMAVAAGRRGADLRPGVAVTGWTAGPGGVTVHCADSDLDADRLVLAPGAWAPVLAGLSVPLRVERRVQHFWRPAQPSMFEPGRLPVWIWEHGDDQAYGMPTVDGLTKAALHHWSADEAARTDPEVGAAAARPDEIEAMRAWLATRIPSLAEGGWIGAKPCLYTLTPDEHFVLGHHPEHPAVAVACGFSGHGFKFAPLFGSILADLVVDGRTASDITLFDPCRFAR